MKRIFISITFSFVLIMVIPIKMYSQPNVKNVTLNNISVKTFEDQRDYFSQHRKDGNEPAMASVWFSSQMISRMVTLLVKEKKADGVRFYFTAYLSASGNDETSIALVSTYTDTPVHYKDQSGHRDYFDHDVSDDYFVKDPASIAVNVDHDDCGGGARLYGDISSTILDCINDDEHYITVDEAKDWVQRCRDKKHPFNTVSEWYDIGLFKKLVYDGDYDGIRIYFCRKKGFLGVLRGRNRLLVVTTKADPNNNKVHIDDYDCQKNGFLWTNKKLDEEKEFLKKFLAAPPQDNGELCPKNCN